MPSAIQSEFPQDQFIKIQAPFDGPLFYFCQEDMTPRSAGAGHIPSHEQVQWLIDVLERYRATFTDAEIQAFNEGRGYEQVR